MRTDLDMVWVVLIVFAQACGSDLDRRCAAERAAQAWPAALASCEAAFERTHDPARAIDAATAALYDHRLGDAVRLARAALDGGTAAEAHQLIGSARLGLGELEEAASHLVVASTWFALSGDAHGEARAEQQLSGAWFQLGDYRQALRAEEASRDAALRARDDRMVVYADIARADVLREIGDLHAAEAAIEQAIAGARDPDDRVMAWLKHGILYLDLGQPALARGPLSQALATESAAPRPRSQILESLHLNLSYVERKARAFERALDELEHARRAGTDEMSYRFNRGRVLADMGKLDEAAADLAAAEAEHPQGDWAWRVPLARAQVAARRGDVAAAIDADRRAIARVEGFARRLGSLGRTLIASHREPHLHLVGLLANEGRWTDVLDVVATMDGQALLDSTELATDPGPSSPPGATNPRGAARTGPAAVPAPDARRALAAWRGQRLVIVVPGGERVWRIDVHDGEVAGQEVGDADHLASLARALEADPGDRKAGRTLGEAMLAPRLPPGTRVALLGIGPLARAPLAGLQLADGPAIARYRLVRVPGILPRSPGMRAGSGAIAIGDPGGDLKAAAEEARRVAVRLGGRVLVGPAATRAALATAVGGDVLHIAAHTTLRLDGATLELADGPVPVTEIARMAPAPRLVVLASCGGAAGRDDAGNGSLVAAFLDAGADLVVGTRWSVGDAEAAGFIEAFYAAGAVRDPAGALARAQLDSRLPATTWAAFEAYAARPESP
ncbi:MAG TPA: CHAT domain-containing protein [Kofleriaceae bacterium]|nr:CHAT domain-containing protein [Kofleriaceae bacterium]